MIYDWYKLADLNDFISSELVSTEMEFILPVIGKKTVLFTKGNLYCMLYEGVFLSLDLNDVTPFEFDDHACFLDDQNFVWLGIKNED